MLMYDVEVFRYRSDRKCGWIGVLIACELYYKLRSDRDGGGKSERVRTFNAPTPAA